MKVAAADIGVPISYDVRKCKEEVTCNDPDKGVGYMYTGEELSPTVDVEVIAA